MATHAVSQPVVDLRDATKQFGPITALRNMSLQLFAGEVHMLLGENGAGKSTLVNAIIGSYPLDKGELRIHGEVPKHYGPATAKKLGIRVVLQDFSLAPTMSVAENLFLGEEPGKRGFVNRKAMRHAAESRLSEFGLVVDPDLEVAALPRAEQQLVEITKAVGGKPGILLLDEPTAAISESETKRLFFVVDRLKANGWAILYITHRMEEVHRLGDRVTVIRDGVLVSSQPLADVSEGGLIRDMVGRELSALYPPKAEGSDIGDSVFSAEHISSLDGKVRDLCLEVRTGEIVAVAGLVGCGKSELVRMIMGLLPLSDGAFMVDGERVVSPTPGKMIKLGVGFMPEERKREALILERSIEENMTIEVLAEREHSRLGILQKSNLAKTAREMVRRLDIRPAEASRPVDTLSGGNQQKVVLARALTRPRRVFVVAEPTSGVDVGARTEIYARLRGLCAAGAGVLMISSDLEEVIGMADRVYVMNGGRIVSELTGDQVTHEEVVAGAFGQAEVRA